MEDPTQVNPDMVEQETVLADDAVPVCSRCLEPCNPLDYYCAKCDNNEAINPLASYMSFVDLRFSVGMLGKLWRETWSPRTRSIDRSIYIGLFILFSPLFLLVGLPVIVFEKMKDTKESPDIQQKS